MKFSEFNFFCACVVALLLIVPVHNAPRSRSKNRPTIKYNQQQSGDYNIQVHLKDFHIIALLGDGALDGSGDYDYNYDYSDFTIKPILPVTTISPEGSSTSSELEDVESLKPEVETAKPSDHPYSILMPSTTHQPLEKLNSTTLQPQSSTNPAPSSTAATSEKTPAVLNIHPDRISVSIINPARNINSTTQKPIPSSESPKEPPIVQKILPQKTTKAENSGEEITEKKTESSVTNISIVPVENSSDVHKEQHIPLGEIMHYRKCAEGYARDKQGRCRKNRWAPQLPFGLSRFASNLASRFRQATKGDTSS